MSKDSPQIPPVVQTSRPLTYSSGLWSEQDATQPVQLPPLQTITRGIDNPSRIPASASVSPRGSNHPSSEGQNEPAPHAAVPRPLRSLARTESDPSRFYYERRAAPLQDSSEPPISNVQSSSSSSYFTEGGEANFISLGPLAPLSAPIYQAETYGGGYRQERRDTDIRSVSDVVTHPTQRLGMRSPRQLLLRLVIRQQPIAARACGFGERDRRLVDPPPILQLVNGNEPGDSASLLNTHFSARSAVAQASLWDETGQYDVTFAQPTNRKPGSRLMGTTFTTSMNAKDESNREGIFFAFSDLSCRTYGRYRLRFALVMIDSTSGQVGSRVPVLDYALSEPFTVYSASDFPGMRPSTQLTKALRESGCAIPVKKGRRSVFGTSLSEDEDEGEGRNEGQTQGGSGKRPPKRTKE